MKFYDCYTIMAGQDSCCSIVLMTIKTRDPNVRDPNFNVAFRPIASFRCDATIRRLSGTRRARAVSPIDASMISRPDESARTELERGNFEAHRHIPRMRAPTSSLTLLF